jgi:hypothetical protein
MHNLAHSIPFFMIGRKSSIGLEMLFEQKKTHNVKERSAEAVFPFVCVLVKYASVRWRFE